MPMRPSKPAFVLIMMVLFAAAAAVAATVADPPRAVSDREEEEDEALTLGALAQLLVSEIALDAPVAGYNEFYSLRVMGAFGYETSRGVDEPAKMDDLRGMLSSLGLEATTSRPEAAVTRGKAGRAVRTVRSSLPKVRVPDGRTGTENLRVQRVERPSPCLDDFHECRRDCLDVSPTGRRYGQVGACIRACQAARKICEANLVLSLDGP